ncbi:uncharacterized protein LOC129319481 [Prosopis cineraria]|uniref:uncharacterized protein LOC129319481 n=1 Tax=Prosopis cineraria TaxID=364024 RepID=UPI00240F361A|nr:uncharacterized protein LOC129319481 [Prosopis cineraria]
MAITICELPAPCSHRRFHVNLDGTEISVTVTATASVVRRWINAVTYFNRHYLSRLIVGLGVQWTPGDRDAPADTLQLCVGRRCLVYQLSHSTYAPKLLRRFLLNPYYTFVGFWNHSDRTKLAISKHHLHMLKDPLDIREYVETDDGESLHRASVEEIVRECLGIDGVRVRPEISMSDWDVMYLSSEQVLQATLDAHCAFMIGKNIGAWRLP